MRISAVIRAAVAATALLAAGVGAAAQETRPEGARPPIKIGPVEMWPSMAFRNIGMDNNVFNEAENPKRDFTATMAPTMELVVRPGRLRLSYTTVSEFVYFHEYKSERSSNRGFVARADLDLTYFTPFASYSSSNTRERPNTEIDVRARRSPRSYTAGVRTKLGALLEVTAAMRRSSSVYDPTEEFRGVNLARALNNDTDAIDASAMFALTPLTSIGVAYAKEEDRFELSPLRDSRSWRLTPTVFFRPLGLFSGTASVGYLRFVSVDPRVADYAGLVARGTISTRLMDRYAIDTSFSRDVRYSYEETTPVYVFTSARGTLRTDLFGGIDVRVGAGRDVMGYKPLAGAEPTDAPDKDVYNTYSLGLGYTIRNRIRIGVDGEFSQRTSDQAARGYENNRVLGTITWGARSQ